LIYPVKQGTLPALITPSWRTDYWWVTDRPLIIWIIIWDWNWRVFYPSGNGKAWSRNWIPAAEVLILRHQQNAEAFRIADRAGSIKPGKWGDAMIIKGKIPTRR